MALLMNGCPRLRLIGVSTSTGVKPCVQRLGNSELTGCHGHRRLVEGHINLVPSFTSKMLDDDGSTRSVYFVGLFSHKKKVIPIIYIHGWRDTNFGPSRFELDALTPPQDLPRVLRRLVGTV